MMKTTFINNQNITIHAVYKGEGPLVVLCHGMPGLWYSWHHQIEALADAGYCAVAIDQRGFGQSDRPIDVEAYTSHHTVADVIAVIDHFNVEQAILIGTDFGAAQVYNCAVRHPDRVKAVIALACPYDFDFSGRGCAGSKVKSDQVFNRLFARPDLSPNQCFAAIAEYQFFYAHYYQAPNLAENEFAIQPERFLKRLFWNLSAEGDLLDQSHWPDEPKGYCDVLKEPDMDLPWRWLSQQDFDYYLEQFTKGRGDNVAQGQEFIGGINLYRAAEENWHINLKYVDANIFQPSLFIAGEQDAVLQMIDTHAIQAFKQRCDDCRGVEIIADAGHFVQMEQPTMVNTIILKFLANL